MVNAAMVTGAISCAMVGWKLPEFSLMISALIGINGLIHLSGSLIKRRLFPGVVTGVLLYLPVSLWR